MPDIQITVTDLELQAHTLDLEDFLKDPFNQRNPIPLETFLSDKFRHQITRDALLRHPSDPKAPVAKALEELDPILLTPEVIDALVKVIEDAKKPKEEPPVEIPVETPELPTDSEVI